MLKQIKTFQGKFQNNTILILQIKQDLCKLKWTLLLLSLLTKL